MYSILLFESDQKVIANVKKAADKTFIRLRTDYQLRVIAGFKEAAGYISCNDVDIFIIDTDVAGDRGAGLRLAGTIRDMKRYRMSELIFLSKAEISEEIVNSFTCFRFCDRDILTDKLCEYIYEAVIHFNDRLYMNEVNSGKYFFIMGDEYYFCPLDDILLFEMHSGTVTVHMLCDSFVAGDRKGDIRRRIRSDKRLIQCNRSIFINRAYYLKYNRLTREVHLSNTDRTVHVSESGHRRLKPYLEYISRI